MNDITRKQVTLREAKAQAIVYCSKESIFRIKSNDLPKGNLFDVAKAAGLLAAKKTPELIPNCHPLVIDGLTIDYKYLDELPEHQGEGIYIEVSARCIARTGIEIEALTTASVTALSIYDMLKPIDKQLTISDVKLLDKKGGRSQFKAKIPRGLQAAILVCSDSVSNHEKKDHSGKKIKEILEQNGMQITDYEVVPDEIEQIQAKLKIYVSQNTPLIITTGGTGLGPRDVTVEAVKPLLEKELPGVAEAMRSHGYNRTPYAMLSRSLAGSSAASLIICMPGSTNGVKESLDAIMPHILHSHEILKGNCIHDNS